MTEIAFFSDVHGNVAALRAVLADLAARGMADAYCLGDLIGYGPDPNGVIDLIRETAIPTILGNYDDGVAFDRGECGCYYADDEARRIGDASYTYTAATVTPERKAWLRGLPRELRVEAADLRLRLVHGSPRRINEYLQADRDERTYHRLAAQADADVLLFGHTHTPWHQVYEDVLFVNVGSAGRPKDGDVRATYTVLRLEEGRPPAVDVHRVAYDVEETARGVLAAGLPAELAEAFRRGA
ncbi:MAG: metallophosphoesterase family protein [Thermoleophilia bacterium]